MKCEITGIPENLINPPDVEDVERELTPSEKVGAFMNGETDCSEFFGLDLTAMNVANLANDFIGLLDVIRNFKADPLLDENSNLRDKMARINEYLDESLLEYVEIK